MCQERTEELRTRATLVPGLSAYLLIQAVPKGDLQLQCPLQWSFKTLYLRDFGMIREPFLGPLGLSFQVTRWLWAISVITGVITEAGKSCLTIHVHFSQRPLRQS